MTLTTVPVPLKTIAGKKRRNTLLTPFTSFINLDQSMARVSHKRAVVEAVAAAAEPVASAPPPPPPADADAAAAPAAVSASAATEEVKDDE